MIHIPRKDELETESVLEQYAKLKKDLVNCQDWLKEIEPLALDEALTILESGNSLSKGKMVYKGNGLRLVLGQRKKFPNEKSDPMLETISSQIRNAELAEIKRNSSELNQITDQIESLRAEIEKLQEKEQALKQNDYIIGLKAQYSDRQQKGQYYEPYLITYQE